MTNPNIGWLFYKQYYGKDSRGNSIDFSKGTDDPGNERLFRQRNQDIFAQGLPKFAAEKINASHDFSLKTTYPGLLLGSGYNHGTGKLGEIKIGFYFDHTTGLPLMPGSSVKGLLRSAFPMRGKTTNESRASYISEKLQQLLSGGVAYNRAQVESLEREIFEGQRMKLNEQKTKEELTPFSIYERDIFYDAMITTADSSNRILSDDYITPHKNTKNDGVPGALKNPTPIMFLKVLPDVTFKFSFSLENSEVIPGLDAAKKLELFKSILLDLGIGAKTNVGYGNFEEV